MTGSSVTVALFVALSAAETLFAQAPVTLVVIDPPGVGFNDPTPATPVGGNAGVTIGEQRLIAFKYGKPRRYLFDFLEWPAKPRIYCGMERDSQQKLMYLTEDEPECL